MASCFRVNGILATLLKIFSAWKAMLFHASASFSRATLMVALCLVLFFSPAGDNTVTKRYGIITSFFAFMSAIIADALKLCIS